MNSKDIIKRIANMKMQLILNKSLYQDKAISIKEYELVENNLLDKIEVLTRKLQPEN